MRSWGLLFAVVTALCVGCFAYAPFNPAWWLPDYDETNNDSLGDLRALQSTVDRAAIELPAILQSLAGGSVDAASPRLDAVKRQIAEQADGIDRLLERQFLTTRVRTLQSERAALAADLASASAGIASRPPVAALDALRRAVDRSAALRSAVAEARESVASLAGQPPSTAASEIDHLFILILGITGVTFLLTMGSLVWSIYRYAARPGRKAVYSHGSLPLEITWTLIPAAVLVFITVYQLDAWADIKFRSRKPDVPPTARVTGVQFGWKMRYPGPDGQLDTIDDLVRMNDLHFVKGEPTLILLDSDDVIHSFFLPQLRIKQDAMPGLRIPVWFDANRAGRYELLCAELCGWGHYKMRADAVAHETREEFDEWQKTALAEQNRDRPAQADVPDAE